VSALLKALRARVETWRQIIEIAEAGWECTGDPRHAVRRSEVVAAVAAAFGVAPSRVLYARVTTVMSSRGWIPISPSNQRLYRGVKRRAHTDEEAVALAKQLRGSKP
jgi:hypothetical protein